MYSLYECIPCSRWNKLGVMWGKEKAVEMLKEAGFTKVDVKQLPHDFQNYYYLCSIN
jgi:hypothetical protein